MSCIFYQPGCNDKWLLCGKSLTYNKYVESADAFNCEILSFKNYMSLFIEISHVFVVNVFLRLVSVTHFCK